MQEGCCWVPGTATSKLSLIRKEMGKANGRLKTWSQAEVWWGPEALSERNLNCPLKLCPPPIQDQTVPHKLTNNGGTFQKDPPPEMAILLTANFKLFNSLWIGGGWPRTVWMPNPCPASPGPRPRSGHGGCGIQPDSWAHLATHLLWHPRASTGPGFISFPAGRGWVPWGGRTVTTGVDPTKVLASNWKLTWP